MYIAETNRVVRFDPGKPAPVVLVPDLPAGGGHSTRTIVLQGNEMFVSVGSSCNLCDERDPKRAAVTRYNLDGSGEQRFATGLRNSVGLALQPETQKVWATNNDRDNLGDDVPPDRVNILEPGGFYGWPLCYLPGKPNPEYARQSFKCNEVVGPAVELPAHSAPLGLAFYQGSMFPAAYRGALLVALHGSWNRSQPIGYKVVSVPVKDGKPVGGWTDFIAGWLKGSGRWGRPVDLLVLPDGSVLISDDEGGRIYRVTYGS
jgi:glucose/arabinose dehydrogenase